jgi:hypothetical protein
MRAQLSPLSRLFVLLACFFAVIAAVSAVRVGDDSFQHFGRSVQQVSELAVAKWLLDTWNKPLNGLLYGFAGMAGLTPARLVSVALSLGTAFFCLRIVERVVPKALRGPSWTIVLLYLGQLAVIKDVFVTMTEIPAGFFLTCGLWLGLERRAPARAGIVAGLAALCRNEMLVVAGMIGVWLSVDAWRSGPRTLRALPRQVLPLALSALPFAAWVAVGAILTGDVLWFNRTAYAELRSFDLLAFIRYNVLTGLPGAMPAPAILCLLLGCLCWPSVVLDPRRRWELVAVGAALGAHYLMLNSLAIIPTVWHRAPADRVLVVLSRNYNCSAAFAVVFMALGIAAWKQACEATGDAVACAKRRSFRSRLLLAAALTTFATVAGRWSKWALMTTDLALLFLSVAVMTWTTQRARSFGIPWQLACSVSLAASLLIRPFFWYPTRWNDAQADSVDALVAVIRREQPHRVVQDLGSSLAIYGKLSGIEAPWEWAENFGKRLQSSLPGTLVIIETDPHGTARERYPAELRAQLQDLATFKPVASFHTAPSSSFAHTINGMAGKNRPVHWTAYRLMPNPSTPRSR